MYICIYVFEDSMFYISHLRRFRLMHWEICGVQYLQQGQESLNWTVWPCFSELWRQVYYNCDSRPIAVNYGDILEYDCWTKRCRNSNADWHV